MAERYQLLVRDRHGFERSLFLNRSVTLGRHNSCEIVLPDTMISRQHLRLDLEDGQWWVEDLGSSHGTFLREERITREPFPPGATLRLADGAYFLTLKAESQTTSEVHLQAVLQTAHLLAAQVDLDELLEQTLDRLLAISGTDRGFIMLLEGGELATKAQRNLGRELEHSIQISMSSVHSVFEKGTPIWIHNVADDEKLRSHQSIVDLKLKTILCLPLTLQGKRTGVLYLDSRRIVGEPVDRPTFEAIVALCAIAIERTRLFEENLRNQVLATVGQVASAIVHDFKNALFVVRGHAELLETQSQDPQVKHHVKKILAAVQRLSQLSTDVLDYSKVRQPHLEKVQLHAWMEGLLEPLQPRAKDLGIRLESHSQPCVAHLDSARFLRVMENLLANAFDAVAGREAPVVTVSWERVTGGVQIRVQDNGRGIPKKVLRRIYEPFFSHGKKKGTGLGMATVKKIVDEHGGSVEVVSEEGGGTSVILTIPDQEDLRGETPAEESTGKSRVPRPRPR
ncbi:MAG: FHA domain-containing protein [Acidobacteria bacterium]|nr:FHA domain-containing protein [Acidobacteriota bacterium]